MTNGMRAISAQKAGMLDVFMADPPSALSAQNDNPTLADHRITRCSPHSRSIEYAKTTFVALSLERTISIGFRSAEYDGRKSIQPLCEFKPRYASAALCDDRLSAITRFPAAASRTTAS